MLETLPKLGWLEIHSENYFGAGGAPHRFLSALRAHYPLSLHGVGLSIGSTDPLSTQYLDALRTLIERYCPGLVSDHLSWGSVDGRYFNDLLPLPYTEESLDHVANRVAQVQEHLRLQLLVENPSTYLRFVDSTIPEAEFLSALARRSGCALLLDVNNVYVSARNHGFDPHRYLRAIEPEAVAEIHLAGFTRKRFDDGEILIDTHNRPVCPAVWVLYAAALKRFGPIPTLIEWDTDLPSLGVLVEEAHRAQRLLEEVRRDRAA